jgi:hypothetical protein
MICTLSHSLFCVLFCGFSFCGGQTHTKTMSYRVTAHDLWFRKMTIALNFVSSSANCLVDRPWWMNLSGAPGPVAFDIRSILTVFSAALTHSVRHNHTLTTATFHTHRSLRRTPHSDRLVWFTFPDFSLLFCAVSLPTTTDCFRCVALFNVLLPCLALHWHYELNADIALCVLRSSTSNARLIFAANSENLF